MIDQNCKNGKVNFFYNSLIHTLPERIKTILVLGSITLIVSSLAADHSSNEDFDHLILSERWLLSSCIDYLQSNRNTKTYCNLPDNQQTWAIHGLWPQKGKTMGPFYCNLSLKFDFDSLKPIKSDLELYWPNIEGGKSTSSLWSHEWMKHGTCAVYLETLDTEFKYFYESLSLFKQNNMNEIFKKLKIFPSNDGIYVKDLLFGLRRILGRNVQIHCITDLKTKQAYLSEVRLCINKNLEPINCEVNSNSWTNGNDSIASQSNCPMDSLVMYPSKINKMLPNDEFKKSKEDKIQYYLKLNYYLKILKFLQWVFL